MFQFSAFATRVLWIQTRSVRESRDHHLFDGFPGLIAVFRALQSLLMPRHPPCALCSLTTRIECSQTGRLPEGTTATVVDGRGDTPIITDGPYLESKELIGGGWVIDVPDLDVALKLAAEASRACRGTVEVRAFDGLA